MIGKQFRFLVFLLLCLQAQSQTTDLSIAIEAQNLSGTAISQVNIFEDFQYVITILNSGNTVNNTSFSVNFDSELTILSFNSQNANAGASDVSNVTITSNVLTASIATMPNNASVELLVLVTAPTTLGGITANGTVTPPTDTQDTNTSNNQSIISIDVLDIEIDFTITHTQINPTEGTAISAWGDSVTYQFTITNNSAIDFPISRISGSLSLSSLFDNGQPFVEFISLDCITTTNGTTCPDLTDVNGFSNIIQSVSSIFLFDNTMVITSSGSITFETVYRYTNFSCSPDPMPIAVESTINVGFSNPNLNDTDSNGVITDLLLSEACETTDICIETVQINPDVSVDLNYDEDITFITTVCNNGPAAASMRFFFQNLTPSVLWTISSLDCIGTTGPVTCDDFTLTINDQIWLSNDFILEANTTITIETILSYEAPECSFTDDVQAPIRSGTNLLDSQIIDIDLSNDFFTNVLILPSVEPCDTNDISDLRVTKTQVNPELPIGSSPQNTAAWGLITYEITVTNDSEDIAVVELQDYMSIPVTGDPPILATLTDVSCISTTGGADCIGIETANIGVTLDGISDTGAFENFWEITSEDNWELPPNSSVTFSVTIDWLPTCTTSDIIGTNNVIVGYTNGFEDSNPTNNTASATTFFAPCLDLIVQTFPEFTQVDVNQTFNWIIDISNSTTSSDAIDVIFEDTLNSVFTIVGNPTCSVTSGNATCISNFTNTGNFVTGTIPTMEAGSTVRISIPVTAPSFGGAFNNIAEAIPDAANNQELTPESNISINSVQVIAPILQKSFTPDTIIEGGESELTFTIFNVASNPTQSEIAFTDTLPLGVTLASTPNWINANGCTATFLGNTGDLFVGVENLVFPDGVNSCTFSVMVTSDAAGTYLNNFQNFTNNNNIDTSQTSATLNVTIDNSNVDIEILKSVTPTEAAFGETVDFTVTATNLGSTVAAQIEITDQLPTGYNYMAATTSLGSFDDSTFIWTIPSLFPNESATLTMEVSVMSSNDLLNIAFLSNLNEIDRDDSNNEADAFVEVSNCLLIPEGISPNDDGLNDLFIIPCIEDYPDNTLKIYNRYGTQIFEANRYLNTWNGSANMGLLKSSDILPVGTYFYILDIAGFEDAFVGYVYLNY